MQAAYLELSYQRDSDQRKATLLAPLSPIRALNLGGSPSDLRLPGLPPDAVLASVSLTYDRYRIEPSDSATDGAGLSLNGAPLPHDGVELSEGDVLRTGQLELTFHDGELPAEPPLLDTALRWKMPRSMVDDSVVYENSDETARAYIEEFQLSARPLIQARRHADVQRLAEAEIKRLVRAEETETLEVYASFLWWTRARTAREAEDARALDIAVEAVDLYPDCMPLLVVCGMSFLRGGVWSQARAAFERALTGRKLPFLASLHDARVGIVLTEMMQRLADPKKKWVRRLDQWKPGDWNVPEINLHAAGDEALLWRMAQAGELFGDTPRRLRFVYRGLDEKRSSEAFDLQRWEIANLKSGLMQRWLLKMPTLPYADPSLAVEVGLLRQAYASEEKDWTQGILDLSNAEEDSQDLPETGPLTVESGAQRQLPSRPGTQQLWVQVACVRLAEKRWVELTCVTQPPGDHVVYRQGRICVAIAPQDVDDLNGARLVYESGLRRRFAVVLPSGERLTARFNRAQESRTRRGRGKPQKLTFLMVVTAVAVVVAAISVASFFLGK